MSARRPRTRTEPIAGPPPPLAAVVGHELGAPLGTIRAAADLLMAGGQPAEEGARLIRLIRLAVHQATLIADDLLGVGSLDAGTFRIHKTAVDPAALLKDLADLWQPAAGDRLQLRLGADLPATIRNDGRRLFQILGNLLSNALKHAPDGEVVLSAERRGSRLVFAVEDAGPGLAPDFAVRPFLAGDPAVPGAGLGLWVSTRLADLIGGRLRLENRPSGGVIASLTFRTGRPRREAPPSLPREPLAGRRVLAIDDSPLSRQILGAVLEAFKVEALLVAGSAAAVAAVADHRPDLLLVDWTLAGETGAMAVERIRAVLGGDLPPVILMSAAGALRDFPGLTRRLPKPFSPAELHGAMVAALSAERPKS